MKRITYATLDDSTYINEENGIVVYSHALVIDDIPKTMFFVGKNEQLFYEERIKTFIEENISDELLYACTHYLKYDRLKELIFQNVDKTNLFDMPKLVRKSFEQSHNYAKQTAKQELERILNASNTI